MEITTAPHRPAPTPWGRLLALVVVLAPVTVLVLLPIGLGLQRYVMSGDSMDNGADGGIAQGTVLFEREVPVSDLRVGDVITYTPPASSGVDGMVTHRIVDIRPSGIVTQGDAQPARDPWVLQPQGPTVSRVAFTLPWVGYAYLAIVHPSTWLLVIVSAAVLALLLTGEVNRRRRVHAARADGATDADEPVRATRSDGTRGDEE